MRRLIVVLTVLAMFGVALPASAASSRIVTNANDSGPGSLRAALEAGQSPVIIRSNVGDIELTAPLVWDEEKKLVIHGTGQTVTDLDDNGDVVDDFDLLVVTKGADTSIRNLSFQGPGGFDLENKGGGSAISVDVPDGARGTVKLSLNRMSISDVRLYGIHIDDLTHATDASIYLSVHRLTVTAVGTGGFDQDGIRVDERGSGHIEFESRDSKFETVGADGVELDEGGPGNVVTNVRDTDFAHNGNYCSFRFDEDELAVNGIVLLDDFEELAIIIDPGQEQDVRDLFAENEEECLEFVEEDGEMEVAIDIDDAFDIDEADEGSIWSKVVGGALVGNEDEGLDFDELGPGDIVGSVDRIEAVDNTDEAIKYSEDGPGDVVATLKGVIAADQDVEFEEFGDGDLESSLTRTTITDLSLVEENEGDFNSKVDRSTLDDVEGEETESGNLNAAFVRSSIDEIELTQETPGSGQATFRNTTYDEANSQFDGVTVS